MFDPAIPLLTEAELRIDGVLESLKQRFIKYDQSYVANACFPERRGVLLGAYIECQPFLDKAFHLEIRQPGKFFPRLWELHICSLLLHWGFDVLPRANRKKSVPDFCIKYGDKRMWVEAVCPDLGDVDAAPAHPDLIPGQLYSRTIDIASDNRPRVVRASSALDAKIKKYKERYLPSGVVSESDPYIIAVNTNRICYVDSTMVEEQLLYGMGLHQINLKTGEASRQWIPNAVKQSTGNETSIPVAYFLRPEYKFISACIFSNRWFDFDSNWKEELSGYTQTYFNEGATNPAEWSSFPSKNRTRSKTTGTQISLERLV